MKLILPTLFVILFAVFNSIISLSQQRNAPFNYFCKSVNSIESLPYRLSGGNYKPERTDNYQGTNDSSVFPVLIVFVKFPKGEPFTNDLNWPPDGDPVYLNNLIAEQKNNNYGDRWWNAYSEENQRLSDFWMEASRGHFHVTGKAYSITLPNTASYYKVKYGQRGEQKINDDIYAILCQLISQQEWYFYDKWKQVNGVFINSPDNYIDMIYKVFRSNADSIGMPIGGISSLNISYQFGPDYSILNTTLKINGAFSSIGSGITLSPGVGFPPLTLKGLVSFSSHEHGHYLFGGSHGMYGKMSGLYAEFGPDECLSPWESIKLGYITPRVVDFGNLGNSLYQLGNFSSRNSDLLGEVLKIPINVNEFFLLANRGQVSSYDKIMWGDTTRGMPYREINPEYGTGLYIYHTPSNYNWPPIMDQECADGLWNYRNINWEHPDWDTTLLLPVFEKVNPVFFKNDISNYDDTISPGSGLLCKDGKSANKYIGSGSYYTSWFGRGKKNQCLGCDGTDKIFTNSNEVWTSRENSGDRWDAWNVGFNQIFSPYSTPSTIGWNNVNTGIFIYLESKFNQIMNIRVYKQSSNMSLDSILHLTPPSKPVLNFKIDTAGCSGFSGYPRISWYNNQEPDMVRSDETKKYFIYRAYLNDLNLIPVEYILLTDYNAGKTDSVSYYIDSSAVIPCNSSNSSVTGFVRYKIIAVDKYDSVSVLSDFASIGVINPIGIINNSIPASYSLTSFPNPFNPVTSIKYSVPKKVHVKIRLFNITGQEVLKPVDENKTAGTYIVKFDGTNYASGIYFCRIEARSPDSVTEEFNQTIKIVLLK